MCVQVAALALNLCKKTLQFVAPQGRNSHLGAPCVRRASIHGIFIAMPTNEVKDAITQQTIDGVRRVTGDSGSTEMHNLKDQVEAARYLAGNEAAASKNAGIRIMKFKPGGAC